MPDLPHTPDPSPDMWTPRRVAAAIALGAAIALIVWWLYRPAAPQAAPEADPVPQSVPVATATPTASPSTSPTPAPDLTQYDGTDADLDGPFDRDDRPSFQPTSDRRPQPGDEAAARDALAQVVPKWATNDTRGGNTFDRWAASWRDAPAASGAFRSASQRNMMALWAALSRMESSAINGRITAQRQLWNAGSHSLWRVTVERDIEPNQPLGTPARPDRITWDILVRQDTERFELVTFVPPHPDNEKPVTFRLPKDD